MSSLNENPTPAGDSRNTMLAMRFQAHGLYSSVPFWVGKKAPFSLIKPPPTDEHPGPPFSLQQACQLPCAASNATTRVLGVHVHTIELQQRVRTSQRRTYTHIAYAGTHASEPRQRSTTNTPLRAHPAGPYLGCWCSPAASRTAHGHATHPPGTTRCIVSYSCACDDPLRRACACCTHSDVTRVLLERSW